MKELLLPNIQMCKKAEWGQLSLNPNANFIFKENKDKINFDCLCTNNSNEAVKILFSFYLKIKYHLLCRNNNDDVVELLLKNPSRICWRDFSMNSNDKAIEYMEQNPEKINWRGLCQNTNPIIINLIYIGFI